MGRLFWKLFFAFWLTLLVAGVGVGVVVWLHRPTLPVADSLASGGPVQFMLNAGANLLRAGGPRALRATLAAQPRDEIFPLYAVDAAGVDLLGRPVAPSLLAAAKRIASGSGPLHSARRVVLGDGRSYLLFVPTDEAHRPPGPAGPGPQPPPRGRPHGPPPPWLPLGAGLVASILFSALLAWYMARPIRHLRRAFEAAAGGDLGVRVQPLIGRRRDEIADLGRDYDRMADRLQELIGAQRRLFHDVSHELRSPLARLQAAVGLIRQNGDNIEMAVERVEREAGRLDDLVGELLLLARLESGVPGTRSGEVDLLALIDDIVVDARFEAETRGCRVEFRGAGPLVTVGQAELLGRAIENVIRNAVKYTAAASTVVVEAQRDGDRLRLRVSDCGPGVAPEALQSIFDPFYRARGGGVGHGGYGLGLAIARRAVEAHGGVIAARNRAEGGLQVEILLPLRVAGTQRG